MAKKKDSYNPNCRTFKTRIYPTKNQIRYFNKCFGLRRWYWNWALDRYITEYKATKKKLTAYQLGKLINNEVFKQGKCLWAKQCNNSIREFVFINLEVAWNNYYNKLDEAKQTTEKIDFEKNKPQFKSKKKSMKSFSTRTSSKSDLRHNIDGKYFKLPMYGNRAKPMSIKTAENLEWIKSDSYKICHVTIKEEYSQYYLFIVYEKTNHDDIIKPNKDTKIGIDMGMKTPLTCWDGNKEYKFNPLDRIKKAEKHRERCDRRLCKKLESYKKQQGYKSYNKGFKFTESKRYKKTIVQLQRAYQREEHIKQDFREKTTTWLVRNYHTINIEPFTDGFKKSRRAVGRISQYAFYERLKQKAEEYDTVINWISWEPTTQTCNICNHRFEGEDKLTMKDRVYKCSVCGNIEDRDVNAAKNIYKLV